MKAIYLRTHVRMLEEFLYELAKLWPIFMSNVKESKRFNFTHYIFYFISLNWCYYCHVFNDLFLKSRNILALHTTNVYIKYNVHQKCQELMVPDTPSVSESFAVRHHLLLAFGLIRQNNSLLCEWPIESIGKCFFFLPAFEYKI